MWLLCGQAGEVVECSVPVEADGGGVSEISIAPAAVLAFFLFAGGGISAGSVAAAFLTPSIMGLNWVGDSSLEASTICCSKVGS